MKKGSVNTYRGFISRYVIKAMKSSTFLCWSDKIRRRNFLFVKLKIGGVISLFLLHRCSRQWLVQESASICNERENWITMNWVCCEQALSILWDLDNFSNSKVLHWYKYFRRFLLVSNTFPGFHALGEQNCLL